MKKYNIQSSADVSLKEILGNQVRISEWASQGLPSDEVCIENAIILENSERWSLMIDPQMQEPLPILVENFPLSQNAHCMHNIQRSLSVVICGIH